MVIAIVPVLGRRPLLNHTLRRLNEIVDQVICVVEDPNDRQMCADHGAFIVNCFRHKLGTKWNAGFWEAKQFNPDFILHMGSRNWFSDNYLDVMLPIAQDYEITGMLDFHFLHLVYTLENKKFYQDKQHKFMDDFNLDIVRSDFQERVLGYWKGYTNEREGEPVGGGRLIRRDYLDRVNWTPFDPKLDKNLDFSMMEKTNSFKGVRADKAQLLAISTNLWSNKHVFDKNTDDIYSERYTNEYLLKWFPEAFKLF